MLKTTHYTCICVNIHKICIKKQHDKYTYIFQTNLNTFYLFFSLKNFISEYLLKLKEN